MSQYVFVHVCIRVLAFEDCVEVRGQSLLPQSLPTWFGFCGFWFLLLLLFLLCCGFVWFFVWNRVSLFCSGWPVTCYVGLAGLKLQRCLYFLCAGTKGVHHHTLPSLYLTRYLSLNLKFTRRVREPLGLSVSVLLCWDFRYVPLHLVFMWMLRTQIQSSCL